MVIRGGGRPGKIGNTVRVFVRFYHGLLVVNKAYYNDYYYLFIGLIRPNITYIYSLLLPIGLTATRLIVTVTPGLTITTGLTIYRAHRYL